MSKLQFFIPRFTVGLIIGTVLLLSFGQLLRIELPGSLALYPHDVLLPIILLLFIWIQRRDFVSNAAKLAIRYRLETLTLLFFILTSLVQLGTTGNPVQLLYLLRLVVYVAALWSMAVLFTHHKNTQCRSYAHARYNNLCHPELVSGSNERLEMLNQVQHDEVCNSCQWLFFGSAALLLWFSFIMYLLFPDSRGLSFFGWDEHYFRLIGTLFDPNFTGMVLVAGTLFSLFVVSTRTLSSLGKNIGVVALIAFSTGIGLTFSRSALVSLALSLVILLGLNFFKQKQTVSTIFKLATLSVCCVILALLVAPKPGGEGIKLLRTASVMTRVTSDSAEVVSNSSARLLLGPLSLLGDSNNQIPTQPTTVIAYHPKTANNFFVTILTWGGAIGLILCLVLLAKWGMFLVKHHPWAAVISAAWLLNAQFNNSIFEPFCFLFVGGLLLSVILTDRSNTRAL